MNVNIDNETRQKALNWVASNSIGSDNVEVVTEPAQPSNFVANKIATKLIKQFESCELRAYPDPNSPLAKELSKHGILRKYMDGKLELPDYLQALSGAPWTIGWGETKGVKQGDVWTQEEADSRLAVRTQEFMSGVVKASPKLGKASPEKLAAVTSLAYNIGLQE